MTDKIIEICFKLLTPWLWLSDVITKFIFKPDNDNASGLVGFFFGLPLAIILFLLTVVGVIAGIIGFVLHG